MKNSFPEGKDRSGRAVGCAWGGEGGGGVGLGGGHVN